MVIGMYKETLKSLLLIGLVISSIVLTYQIWNYTPKLTSVESTTTTKSSAIGPRNNDNIRNIFMPFQMVQYKQQAVRGTSDTDTIMEMTDYIVGSQVKKIEKIDNNSKFLSRNLGDSFTIFDYTTDVPDAMYLTSVLNLNKVVDNLSFRRLIVDSRTSETLTLYFISNEKVLKMNTATKSKDFNKLLQQNNKNLDKYTGIITNEKTADEKTNLYAPSSAKHAKAFRYMADRINVEDINNAVLDDKEHVIERNQKDGTTYFSNTGVVSIKNDEIYKYTNLSEESNKRATLRDSLIKSYSFISNHGGFTDDYRLFSVRPDHTINYQMYLSGLPVFNNAGLSEINVIWGERKEYEYRRGLLSTSVAVPSTTKASSLPSAEEVRFALATNKHFRFEDVKQIMLGYKMVKKDPSDMQIQTTLTFTPAWFVEYRGEWKEFKDGRLE